jgi:hypothetical protein
VVENLIFAGLGVLNVSVELVCDDDEKIIVNRGRSGDLYTLD